MNEQEREADRTRVERRTRTPEEAAGVYADLSDARLGWQRAKEAAEQFAQTGVLPAPPRRDGETDQ